jgi:hypothetical protein
MELGRGVCGGSGFRGRKRRVDRFTGQRKRYGAKDSAFLGAERSNRYRGQDEERNNPGDRWFGIAGAHGVSSFLNRRKRRDGRGA